MKKGASTIKRITLGMVLNEVVAQAGGHEKFACAYLQSLAELPSHMRIREYHKFFELLRLVGYRY